ncbi:hypothetical protein [Blastococcus saxobsidens]|uniref:Uncharacterized protein n=1 Tax=Blastococcus saxobsidens (strain DD2) TaxID=1146883 RepID=H6RIQ5_BLASD|nr:hypothetical protein [Blastococcus saxobsidens]CCG02249.1 Protein of unknown function [Blastococcus saxobsidens DD2]
MCQSLRDDAGAAAAAATVAIYLMMDTGLMAPVRGWLARTERLLGNRPESPTHAPVAMARTYERFMCGDAESAVRWAERAIELGGRQGVPLAAALSRVAAARLVILDGSVERGLELLDEAAVSVVSGELDPLGAGMVYCELICAMQGLAQYDRAEQWTEVMERWRVGHAYGGINGRCRVHRAEILRLRGSCSAAEEEALKPCRELWPWMRREFGRPLTELGALRRAPLLAAQVEIGIAAADVGTARTATAQLSGIAETFPSRALTAAAALSRGRVALAEGDAEVAVRESTEALTGWSEVGAPYEAAVARLVLADGERLRGRTEQAQVQEQAALATADRIGALLPTRGPVPAQHAPSG